MLQSEIRLHVKTLTIVTRAFRPQCIGVGRIGYTAWRFPLLPSMARDLLAQYCATRSMKGHPDRRVRFRLYLAAYSKR